MGKMKFAKKKTTDVVISDETWKILICDDEKEVHTITKTVLSDFVFDNKKLEFISAYSGEDALKILKDQKDIAVVFLDVVMETDFAGLEVVKGIRGELKNRLIRIILRTGQPGYAPEKEVIQEYDINDYKEKTELTDIKLFTTLISALRAFKDMVSIQNLNKEIMDTQKELIETLGETVERRSKEASHHVRRVANLSYNLALKAGLSEEEAVFIRNASPMHDVGKIGIPDSILLKPDTLTDEEFEVMKTHTDIGRGILTNSKRPILKAASIIAYEHHEKWDGTGYPNGLKGDQIHIYGRITSVADVFDALLHSRCYKEAWDIESVIKYFEEEKGKQFDANLVDILLNNIDTFQDIIFNDQ